MQLLITTSRQDIRTNFSCVRDRSTLFTHFSGQFFKIIGTCHPFKVIILKINFTTISFKSNTKFSVILTVG